MTYQRCAHCGNAITGPRDAYGDAEALVCRACWQAVMLDAIGKSKARPVYQGQPPMPGPVEPAPVAEQVDPWPVLRWASDVTLAVSSGGSTARE